MKKRYFWWLLLMAYFVVIGYRLGINSIWRWGLGWVLSLVIRYIDRMMQVYLLQPNTSLSQEVKVLVNNQKYRLAFQLVRKRADEQDKLLTQSVLFMAVYLPLTWYVVTSSGSMVAIGMMMGLGMGLLMEIILGW